MDGKTINFVMSSRNREAKSAYTLAAVKSNILALEGKRFIVDCDSERHSTSLTGFLDEMIKAMGIELEKNENLKPIQLKIGDIWFPPIIMNNYAGVNESIKNLFFDLKELYNKNGSYSFCFPVEKLSISQFNGNIMGPAHLPPKKDNGRISCSHVFVDCSGHLLANGTSIVKKSIIDIKKHLFPNPKVFFHYIMRIREVVSQQYYTKVPSAERRDVLLYCIKKDLEEKLDLFLEGTERPGKVRDELPPMARFIDGIVLVFNMYSESRQFRDSLFRDMLENDLKKITTDLKWIIPPDLREIYLMKKCKKLLGTTKKYHERIYDYLTAAMGELPNDCLERIG